METENKRNSSEMSQNERIRAFHSLKREESFVLYWKLKEKDHPSIGDLMGFSDRTVDTISGRLNKIFKVRAKDLADLREKTIDLMSRYAPETDKWVDWTWPTERLITDFLALPTSPQIENVGAEKPVEETPIPIHGTIFDTSLNPREGTWQEAVKQIALNRTYQLVAFGVLAFLTIVFFITRNPPPRFSPVTATGTALAMVSTETAIVTATMPPTPVVTLSPTPLDTLTSASTQTSEPTEKPTETSTPEPSMTPTVTPTPEEVLLSDDFSNDFSKWNVYNPDKAFIADGQFVSGDFYGTWISTEVKAENFKIIVVTNGGATGTSGVIIAPAFVDPNNYFGFRTNFCDRDWRIVKKRIPQVLTNFEKQCFEKLTVEITVTGKNMDVQINGIEIGSALNNQIPYGKVGLMADAYGKIDSVKIIKLP